MQTVAMISKTWKALNREYWAADDMHDWLGVNRIGACKNDIERADMESPVNSNDDAAVKLWFAAHHLRAGGEPALAKRLGLVGGAIEHGDAGLCHLIELRAVLAALAGIELDVGAIDRIAPRIAAALSWLARPRRVDTAPMPVA